MECVLLDGGTLSFFYTISCKIPSTWWKDVLSAITPAIVLASAIIAWRSLRNTRALARQKATLDLIEKVESTEHYRRLTDTFRKALTGNLLTALGAPADDAERAMRTDILDYLNHYELVAIGIHHGILDEAIYRAWMASHVLMEWNASADLIQQERWRLNGDATDFEYRATLFCNLQKAVSRWSPKARHLDDTSSPKPPLPIGPVPPGDVSLSAAGQPALSLPAAPQVVPAPSGESSGPIVSP